MDGRDHRLRGSVNHERRCIRDSSERAISDVAVAATVASADAWILDVRGDEDRRPRRERESTWYSVRDRRGGRRLPGRHSSPHLPPVARVAAPPPPLGALRLAPPLRDDASQNPLPPPAGMPSRVLRSMAASAARFIGRGQRHVFRARPFRDRTRRPDRWSPRARRDIPAGTRNRPSATVPAGPIGIGLMPPRPRAGGGVGCTRVCAYRSGWRGPPSPGPCR